MDVDEDFLMRPSKEDDKTEHCNGSDWAYYLKKEDKKCMLTDISKQAFWTLSSCKTDGYGVHELLDESVDKYWQSDGPQPHTVTIEFSRKTDISFLWLYLDYKNDESYTPSKVIVYVGSSLMHLDEGREHQFQEPVGWQYIDLRTAKNSLPRRAMVIQLQVVHNHQNGRDTHIRHIRVAGPARSRFNADNRLLAGNPSNSNDFRTLPVGDIHKKFINSMVIR